MTVLRVVAVNSSLILTLSRGPDGQLAPTDGADSMLLRMLSTYVPFEYELIQQQDSSWGNVDEDGRWTGMIGTLQREEADVALGWIANTYSRSQVVDFSAPYMVDAIVFVTPSPQLQRKDFAFLEPFQNTVWTLLLLSLPISALVLTLLQRYACTGVKGRRVAFVARQLRHLENLSVMLLGQGSFDRFSRDLPSRVFLSLWTVSKLVLGFAYCSLLLSILMVPRGERPVETVRELREAVLAGRYHVAVYRGISHYEYLMGADSGPLKDFAADLGRHPENVLSTFEECRERLGRGERLAVLNMRTHFGLVSSEAGAFLFHSSLDTIGHNPVSAALRKGLPDAERINLVIHRINESGLYRRQLDLLRYKFSLKAPRPPTSRGAQRPLTLEDVRTPLGILALAQALALICLLVERAHHRRTMKSSAPGLPN